MTPISDRNCVQKCNLAYHRSVAKTCVLYKTRSNPMYRLCGVLPFQHVPVWVTRGASVAVICTRMFLQAAEPHSTRGISVYCSRSGGYILLMHAHYSPMWQFVEIQHFHCFSDFILIKGRWRCTVVSKHSVPLALRNELSDTVFDSVTVELAGLKDLSIASS